MAYTVLARRYRSQGFDEVVGQQAIARTLKNAIDQDRVAHAYLFVGTRGVGKTSMARIFAKALNGGTPEVDAAIMRGEDTDVIEIDAASNRRVEDARELIANSIYRPLRGKHKIYIIDEVHMLTKDAFNTLLKVMEEPPEHVKFILYTTEPHKVLPTIQSRCQRFDFRAIPTADIAAHMRAVLDQENLGYHADAVSEVARLAAGSMRDGLSILDRLIAAAGPGNDITVELIEQVLGIPPRQRIAEIISAFAAGDPAAALNAAEALLMQATDADSLLEALIRRFRDLLVLGTCGNDTPLVELSEDARDQAITQARAFDAATLVHMIAMAENVQRAMRISTTPRALLDALLVRLALSGAFVHAAAPPEAALAGARPGKA